MLEQMTKPTTIPATNIQKEDQLMVSCNLENSSVKKPSIFSINEL